MDVRLYFAMQQLKKAAGFSCILETFNELHFLYFAVGSHGFISVMHLHMP